MQQRITIGYADPSEQLVTITLTGTLKSFEELVPLLGGVPFYAVDRLIEGIRDASRLLRDKVEAKSASHVHRKMLPGDIGFVFHEERRH